MFKDYLGTFRGGRALLFEQVYNVDSGPDESSLMISGFFDGF